LIPIKSDRSSFQIEIDRKSDIKSRVNGGVVSLKSEIQNGQKDKLLEIRMVWNQVIGE